MDLDLYELFEPIVHILCFFALLIVVVFIVLIYHCLSKMPVTTRSQSKKRLYLTEEGEQWVNFIYAQYLETQLRDKNNSVYHLLYCIWIAPNGRSIREIRDHVRAVDDKWLTELLEHPYVILK